MDLFVVGTSRSGSTMVREILAGHPDVAILNESHWLPWLHHLFGRTAGPVDDMLDVVGRTHWDTGRPVIEVNAELAGMEWRDLRSRVRTRLGTTATLDRLHDEITRQLFGADSAVLADKTPDYGFYMRLLQDLWPRARFLHVVRDGLTTALSMSRHSGVRRQVAGGFDNWCPLAYGSLYAHLEDRFSPPADFVATWRRRLDRIRAEAAGLRPDTYFEVRYEHLLDDPRRAISDVARFMGVDTDPAWLDEVSHIPRPRNREVDASVLPMLSLADLRRLSELGEGRHLMLAPDGDAHLAQDQLREGDEAMIAGDADRAMLVGLSILATAAAGSDAGLRAGAIALVAEAASVLAIPIDSLRAEVEALA